MLEVISHTLGIETVGGAMTALIKRNATILTKKSEIFSPFKPRDKLEIYSTGKYSVAPSASAPIRVYDEGDSARSMDESLIGILEIPGIPAVPYGVPQIEVILLYRRQQYLECLFLGQKNQEVELHHHQLEGPPSGRRRHWW